MLPRVAARAKGVVGQKCARIASMGPNDLLARSGGAFPQVPWSGCGKTLDRGYRRSSGGVLTSRIAGGVRCLLQAQRRIALPADAQSRTPDDPAAMVALVIVIMLGSFVGTF
jgi:hypothetical protein